MRTTTNTKRSWCILAKHIEAMPSNKVHATRLRRYLLEDHDPVVPPSSDRVVNYSKAGTDVGPGPSLRRAIQAANNLPIDALEA